GVKKPRLGEPHTPLGFRPVHARMPPRPHGSRSALTAALICRLTERFLSPRQSTLCHKHKLRTFAGEFQSNVTGKSRKSGQLDELWPIPAYWGRNGWCEVYYENRHYWRWPDRRPHHPPLSRRWPRRVCCQFPGTTVLGGPRC